MDVLGKQLLHSFKILTVLIRLFGSVTDWVYSTIGAMILTWVLATTPGKIPSRNREIKLWISREKIVVIVELI